MPACTHVYIVRTRAYFEAIQVTGRTKKKEKKNKERKKEKIVETRKRKKKQRIRTSIREPARSNSIQSYTAYHVRFMDRYPTSKEKKA